VGHLDLGAADDPHRAAREAMVASQIAARGVRDPAVLAAMRRIPRHEFVPPAARAAAYEDRPLAIGEGQTISQPYVVAAMTELAALAPTSRVLEVGTGCGYQTAVLAALAAEVFSIEIVPALAAQARARLVRLGVPVALRVGDGRLGWPEAAPFDAIVVTAAPALVPEPLRAQLAIGGRLIVPVGPNGGRQELVRITRRAADRYDTEVAFPVAFVPMTGGSARA
jgi:protein-L-isoaspartate(D-aspartate) O-methyltransferase